MHFSESHSAEHATSSKNFKRENLGMPNGSNMIWRKQWVHHRPHSTMVESGANSLLGPLPCSENRNFISYIIGKTVVAQTLAGPIYLSSVREGKIECYDDIDSGKPITVWASKSPRSRNHVLWWMGIVWFIVQAARYLRLQVGGHLG